MASLFLHFQSVRKRIYVINEHLPPTPFCPFLIESTLCVQTFAQPDVCLHAKEWFHHRQLCRAKIACTKMSTACHWTLLNHLLMLWIDGNGLNWTIFFEIFIYCFHGGKHDHRFWKPNSVDWTIFLTPFCKGTMWTSNVNLKKICEGLCASNIFNFLIPVKSFQWWAVEMDLLESFWSNIDDAEKERLKPHKLNWLEVKVPFFFHLRLQTEQFVANTLKEVNLEIVSDKIIFGLKTQLGKLYKWCAEGSMMSFKIIGIKYKVKNGLHDNSSLMLCAQV